MPACICEEMGEHGAPTDDLSGREFLDLAWRYLRIPLILLIVEVSYRLLTYPRNTLGLLQVFEAYVWHGINLLVFGAESSTIAEHRGWMTKVVLHHPSFPSDLGHTLPLYVSDECAGMHEFVFFAALVLMSEGVDFRRRLRAVMWAAPVIFVLNMIRLVVLYPVALYSCSDAPGQPLCDMGMWEFHNFILTTGSMAAIVGAWMFWFIWAGGAKGTLKRTMDPEELPARLKVREPLPVGSWVTLAVAGLLFLWAGQLAFLDKDGIDARQTSEDCIASGAITPACSDAHRAASDMEWRAWSLTVISLMLIPASVLVYERPSLWQEE